MVMYFEALDDRLMIILLAWNILSTLITGDLQVENNKSLPNSLAYDVVTHCALIHPLKVKLNFQINTNNG